MKTRNACALISLLAVLNACSKVPVGAVGIMVNNMGGDKGVADEVLKTGWYWAGFTKTLYTFPTFMQTRKWEGKEEFSFQTVEGLVVGAPISISYSVDPTKVPVLFQTYRKGLDEITDVYIHNIIRDALVIVGSTQTIDNIYGAGKEKLLGQVQKTVAEKMEPLGIKVDQISLVGQFSLPEAVVTSINAKIQATQEAQQRENEVASSKANAQKVVAEAQGEAQATLTRAQAQAQANELLAKSVTPQLVQYQAIAVQKNAVDKWNGILPLTMAGAMPFIDVGPK